MIEGVTREVFKETKGVSYSKLSKLADGPKAYKLSLERPATGEGLDLGSVVDCKLFTPDNFDKEFYVMTADKPSSEMMLIFAEVYAMTGSPDQAYRASGYKMSFTRVLESFEKEGRSYANALTAAGGRRIVDAEMVMKANQIVSELRSNPFTKNYFIPENSDIELKFQVPIIWDIKVEDYTQPIPADIDLDVFDIPQVTVKAKGILDIARIDHKHKTITPADQKVGGEGFMKSWWKYHYYLQGSMYFYGAEAVFPKDYTVKPTRFIYADSNLFNPPLIYKMTQSDLYHGRHGYIARDRFGAQSHVVTRLKNKGYEQLAAELYWHEKNNQWEYPYEIYNRSGEVEIDAFSVKL